jgi:hypothetical protein
MLLRTETEIEVSVEKLRAKHDGYSSFKLSCEAAHKDKLMDNNLWPPGVLFRQWYPERTKDTPANGTNDQHGDRSGINGSG